MQTAYAENRTGREKGSPAMFSVSVTVEVHLTIDGEYRDADTGLIYLRARWYSPDIGRFITMDEYEGDQEDPITLNKYLAFDDNPIEKMDPSGYTTSWGTAISALFKIGHALIGGAPTLRAQSIIKKNYTSGDKRGMTGTQMFEWFERGRILSDKADGVKWVTGYMQDADKLYEHPTYPGIYDIAPSPEGARYPISINVKNEPLIRFHRKYISAGCIVYGDSKIGEQIEARILENFILGIHMNAVLQVIDNRTSVEKKLRPLPY